jgi:CRISPR-associated exonuclease Cas4
LFEGERVEERKRRFHMARWVNPERGEMFFAKRVAFVEGETEKTLLPFLAAKLGCFDEDVSVLDCAGKHNLPLYIAIANAFRIPYVVLHDEDPLPDPIPADWNQDKQRQRRQLFEVNQEIADAVDTAVGRVEVLSPDLERVAGVSSSQGERKGKALAALEYFRAMEAAAVPSPLQQVVRCVYGTPALPERVERAVGAAVRASI